MASRVTSVIDRGRDWRVALVRAIVAGLCLLLCTPGVARAQPSYQHQPIARLLDLAEDPRIVFDGWFRVGSLDDQGRLVFTTMTLNDAGGHNLVLYGGGAFHPLVLPEAPIQDGTWPKALEVLSPVSTNQHGRVVFAATPRPEAAHGVFLWDEETQQLSDVALPGAAVLPDLTLVSARFAPAINNPGEIAFGALIRRTEGPAGQALFFRDVEGGWAPVALPDQPLPGGGNFAQLVGAPTLNDAGKIAFVATRAGEVDRPLPAGAGAYLWGPAGITPLALPGAALAGGTVHSVTGAWVNNRNEHVLVAARVAAPAGRMDALCRFVEDALTPLVTTGQEMPGGGRLLAIGSVSFASEAGEHVFLATLDSGTAAYLLDAEGGLSLVLKSSQMTELGRVAAVGAASTWLPSSGIGLNSRRQIVLPVRIDSHSPMLLLVSPNVEPAD